MATKHPNFPSFTKFLLSSPVFLILTILIEYTRPEAEGVRSSFGFISGPSQHFNHHPSSVAPFQLVVCPVFRVSRTSCWKYRNKADMRRGHYKIPVAAILLLVVEIRASRLDRGWGLFSSISSLWKCVCGTKFIVIRKWTGLPERTWAPPRFSNSVTGPRGCAKKAELMRPSSTQPRIRSRSVLHIKMQAS